MDILENKAAWEQEFRQGWLAKLQAENAIDWSLYRHPRNEEAPGIPGVDLRQSRLLFITSTGAYLRDRQRPFDAPSLTGDYTIRTIPTATPFADLAYAHDHFDHAMVDEDPQVALPLRHLEKRVAGGRIGELASSVISFMGYQPDAGRVVDETIPAIVAAALAEGVQAALLAPVWPICHQSVGLAARALEMVGIATVVVAWNGGCIRLVKPPRAVITRLPRGTAFGRPGDTARQQRVLETALTQLTQNAPIEPLSLPET